MPEGAARCVLRTLFPADRQLRQHYGVKLMTVSMLLINGAALFMTIYFHLGQFVSWVSLYKTVYVQAISICTSG